MPDQISSAVKKERYKELNALNNGMKSAYLKSQIGKNLDIIIEETHGDSTSVGKSGNYLKVEASSERIPGEIAGDCKDCRGSRRFAEGTSHSVCVTSYNVMLFYLLKS